MDLETVTIFAAQVFAVVPTFTLRLVFSPSSTA